MVNGDPDPVSRLFYCIPSEGPFHELIVDADRYGFIEHIHQAYLYAARRESTYQAAA
jgi:hypothetical protein